MPTSIAPQTTDNNQFRNTRPAARLQVAKWEEHACFAHAELNTVNRKKKTYGFENHTPIRRPAVDRPVVTGSGCHLSEPTCKPQTTRTHNTTHPALHALAEPLRAHQKTAHKRASQHTRMNASPVSTVTSPSPPTAHPRSRSSCPPRGPTARPCTTRASSCASRSTPWS